MRRFDGVTKHRVGHVLALVLIMAWVLTSCLGQFPGSTDPLLKIGLVAPFEGRWRARGYQVLYAVKLAVRQWNEAGGVGGYRVELVALDDGGDPAVAVRQVRELAVDEGVLGVIGHFMDETTSAAALEYAIRGLVLIAPGMGGDGITGTGWGVRAGPSVERVGAEAADYAVKGLAATRMAVLRGQSDWGGESCGHVQGRCAQPSLADAFVAAIHQLGGIVVSDESIAEDGWLSRLAEASPDLVFFSGDAIQGAEAIRLARRAGIEAAFLGGPALGDRLLVQMGGAAIEGTIYLATAPAGADVPDGEAFVAGYQSLAGYPPGPRATLAYEATHMLLEAIACAADRSPGRPSRTMVQQQLTGNCQHEALLGRLFFDGGETDDWPIAIYRIEAASYPGRRLR